MTGDSKEPSAPVVLIIDDDPGVRSAMRMMLEDDGFSVFTAENGDEGLAIMLAADDPIDLVITDINMPGKAGNETIHDIRKIRPGIGIIAMSGGGRAGNFDFLEVARKQGADAVLQKPFEMDELVNLARQVASAR